MTDSLYNYIYMPKLSQQEFIKRCNTKHNSKYLYDKTVFTGTRSKVIVTCPQHGDFTVNADNHMRTSGCPKCGTISGAAHTTVRYDEFIKRVYDRGITHLMFNRDEYTNSRTPITVTCTKHGNTFSQSPYSIYTGRVGCTDCISEKISLHGRGNTQTFIDKCQMLYGDTLSYDKVVYENNIKDVIVGCNMHGDFARSPKLLLRGYHCPVCMKDNIYLKNAAAFEERFHTEWKDYKLKSMYKGAFHPMVVECKHHGEFEITPEQCRTREEICERCRSKNGSKQERKLFDFLEQKGIRYITHHKVKTDKTYFEVDVLLPDHNIAIEVNGLYWHREQENTRYTKTYHLNKTLECEKRGIQLLHFYDTEIDTKFDIVRAIITTKLNLNEDKIYARNTQLRYITKTEKRDFLNRYHLQGNDRSSTYIGLFYNEELVCVMTFGTRKITGSLDHELMRFCVKSNTSVVGGFSKLLKRYRTDFKVSLIKTYADRRYSSGEVYKKNGFKFVKFSDPSYWYFNITEYKLHHRYNFAKHLLKDRMCVYDESLTEREIMNLNNYHRIWDCGQCVFIL
jgi:hypothetical protein